ncbi:Hydrogenase assembly chaperone hypC/hupF [Paraburkholderia piptadeniae]|uniref:HypC/HybG/HupF family hydrogenase formation chaperone n=2 Tax=Paraburkholderia TaxID=1822464 RepID=A0A7X1NJZ4_9BURK|nr:MULTISPECIES: HypC/HybG/HupF family hydrogenase formation chaperone [Paraburkholderia]MPW22883.1 HypC/HybG/HupF family hydrogenase formation chaperone [Paraburkholderia franconis]SIT52194.1 Hydrogenase assembly chaperone hypC/hupF [Paraburkholderia piptadeniae]
MCLAIPVEVVELQPGERARVSVDGVTREISLALVENVASGDFVLLHVGYAIGTLDRAEADATLAQLAALAASCDADAAASDASRGNPA